MLSKQPSEAIFYGDDWSKTVVSFDYCTKFIYWDNWVTRSRTADNLYDCDIDSINAPSLMV